jgi:hypothetical protein
MAFTKKPAAGCPPDDETAEGKMPTAPPGPKKKGKMPVPGASAPAWKKIAAAMSKK